MNKYYELLTQNAALSAFLGAIMGAGFMWFITSPLNDDLIKYGTYGFSALVALFASGVAWHSAMANVKNQQEHAKSENEKSLLAARAVLPPVLSSLYNKAKLGFDASSNQLSLRTTPHVARDTLEKLTLTPEELTVLKGCIKYSDKDTARWLSLLISHFQIHHARLDSKLFTAGLVTNGEQIANDALYWSLIRTMVAHLFEFSRTGKIPASDLARGNISIPLTYVRTGPVTTHWDKVYKRMCDHFEDTDGWSSIAFQKRLLN